MKATVEELLTILKKYNPSAEVSFIFNSKIADRFAIKILDDHYLTRENCGPIRFVLEEKDEHLTTEENNDGIN